MENIEFSETAMIAKQKRAIRLKKAGADFLCDIVGEEFYQRLKATNRKFENAADLFSLSDCITKKLTQLPNVFQIDRYEMPHISEILSDITNKNIYPLAKDLIRKGVNPSSRIWSTSPDLVISAFGMHYCSDVPLWFKEILNAMKPDGLFMAALPGVGTLIELRDALMRAESLVSSGAGLRVDPFIDVETAGKLLQGTGFKLSVIDRENVTVRYNDMFELVSDLRAMGVTRSVTKSGQLLPARNVFKKADEIYRQLYSDPDGRIRASFNIIYLTGWCAHASQQKPLRPGSAKTSLADYLKSTEG